MATDNDPEDAGGMGIDAIMAALDSTERKLPKKAIRAARKNRELIVPRLIQAIRDAMEETSPDHSVEGTAAFLRCSCNPATVDTRYSSIPSLTLRVRVRSSNKYPANYKLAEYGKAFLGESIIINHGSTLMDTDIRWWRQDFWNPCY